MVKEKNDADTKIGLGKYINAGMKRPRDKNRIERFWIQLPIPMAQRPDFPFKDGDQLVVQLVEKRLIVTKLDLARSAGVQTPV